MFECDFCDRTFGNAGSGKLHQRNCDLNPSNKTYCKECDEVLIGGSQKDFCSRSCAATHNNRGREKSEETKAKISQSRKGQNNGPGFPEYVNYANSCSIHIKECKYCEELFIASVDKPSVDYRRTTCSDNCLHLFRSEHSRKVVADKLNKRSKNEKYFAKLCEEEFDKVLTNEPMFNGWDADVILPNYKIAVLWNGRWHYEKIMEQHSLAQVQNRDRIKKSEIREYGYRCYVIKDMGGYDTSFVDEQFEQFKTKIAG